MAEDQVCGQTFDLRQLPVQRAFAAVAVLQILDQFLKVDELQQIGQIDLGHQLFNLLLPFHLGEFALLHVQAQRIQIGQPLGGDRLDLIGKRIAGEQRIQQRERQ